MKIFEISLNDELFNEWHVVLSQKVNIKYQVIDCIENNKEIILGKEDKIQMFLINIESNKDARKEIPFQSDILYWKNDITLDAYSPFKGIIISENLKNILSNYNLPPHFLYPLEIVNSESLELNNNYYLFYSHENMLDLTLFNESEYTYYKRRKEIKKSVGEFNSFEEYDKEYDRVFDKENMKIKITNRVISSDYDLLPSPLNYLRVKENFMKDKNKLEGLIFKEQINLTIKQSNNL